MSCKAPTRLDLDLRKLGMYFLIEIRLLNIIMKHFSIQDPIEQDLQEILDAVSFADKIIFGRTNYCKEANSYKNHKAFYNQMAAQVMEFCEEHGIQCHIKEKTITEG